jgi:hypothetical protein
LLDPSNDPEFFWQVISGPPVYENKIYEQNKNALRKNIMKKKLNQRACFLRA